MNTEAMSVLCFGFQEFCILMNINSLQFYHGECISAITFSCIPQFHQPMRFEMETVFRLKHHYQQHLRLNSAVFHHICGFNLQANITNS